MSSGGLMEKILAVCMPPPTKDGQELKVTGNEMNGEILHQTYEDGTVGKISMADDEKQPESFVIVTRTIEKDGQTHTSTLKKSKEGFKMKDTNIFNCFDAKIAEALESEDKKYKGAFSTTQIRGEEVTRYTREHDNMKETWTKAKVEKFQTDDETVTVLETKEVDYKDGAEFKKALSEFTGMEIPE